MPINIQLLDAIAADVNSGGKLPCSILRMILMEESTSRFKSSSVDQALILLALYRMLLKALKNDLSDLDLTVSSTKKKWDKTRIKGISKAAANQIAMKKIVKDKPILFLNTNKFLRSLPIDFVQQIARWAPPVVTKSKLPNQPMYVFENQLSAFIASYVLADRVIKVKVLEQSPKPHFNLYDLLALLEYIEPIYKENSTRIAIIESTQELGELITGFSKSYVYKLRQRSKVEADV